MNSTLSHQIAIKVFINVTIYLKHSVNSFRGHQSRRVSMILRKFGMCWRDLRSNAVLFVELYAFRVDSWCQMEEHSKAGPHKLCFINDELMSSCCSGTDTTLGILVGSVIMLASYQYAVFRFVTCIFLGHLLQRPSVRRPSSLSKISNISSETAWPIKAKLYVEYPWEGGTKVYINEPRHMTKMVAMALNSKNLKNLLLQNQKIGKCHLMAETLLGISKWTEDLCL